ncbi:hypothetical protein GR11A_00209 [Vibrio phage vB_VcorM_GR11A]|nr:hypothetical protein GR11A_00209 [Vibrio phage vB_VcorM_GR11A]
MPLNTDKNVLGFYRVTNQSQFRDLLKFHGFQKFQWESARAQGMLNYPTHYPCMVKVNTGYHGYEYPVVTWLGEEELFRLRKELENGN